MNMWKFLLTSHQTRTECLTNKIGMKKLNYLDEEKCIPYILFLVFPSHYVPDWPYPEYVRQTMQQYPTFRQCRTLKEQL